MLKNSIRNFFIGSFMVIFGFIAMIIAVTLLQKYVIYAAFCAISMGHLLIRSSLAVIDEHKSLMLNCFFKKIPTNRVLALISKARLICLFENYEEWWRSQKDQGLNSEHVSLGIYISILSGILNKEDILAYSKHLHECPICQNYIEHWKDEMLNKIKQLKSKKQSDPF